MIFIQRSTGGRGDKVLFQYGQKTDRVVLYHMQKTLIHMEPSRHKGNTLII